MTGAQTETAGQRATSVGRLRRLYDEGYFHGRGSGYPSEGYRLSHPDWGTWLDFLGLLQPTGVLIDVGCAFGYLVGQARKHGYQASGIEISDYALAQEPALRPLLIQGTAEELPLSDRSVDVVTLFDVLEHLGDPDSCLAECRRVLRPEGLIIGATPDPLFFPRQEPTHLSERPPSHWIAALRRLGFEVQFRFSVEAYNFQFLAAPSGSSMARKLGIFQHDFFGTVPDFINVQGPLTVAPRSGWGGLCRGSRQLERSPASLYLLNELCDPLRVKVRLRILHSPEFSTVRLRFNCFVVTEAFLTSENTEHILETPPFYLPPGGHHLFLEVSPGGPTVQVSDIAVGAEVVSGETLTVGLPFDLYQRYRLTADLISLLQPTRVLDVGGFIGDQGGHVATLGDFLQGTRPAVIQTTDLRACDFPGHRPTPAWKQPFADQAFDLVLSLDVLEHLPGDRRGEFLRELDRLSARWIVLGGPFLSPSVEGAEELLASGLMAGNGFLQEHRELGLPQRSLVEDYFAADRGYVLWSVPNGYLPRWQMMQVLTQHYFGFNDYQVIREFNQWYNSRYYACDQMEPAYRTVFLISKAPLTEAQIEGLARLRSSDSQPSADRDPEISQGHTQFCALHTRVTRLLEDRRKALSDIQFLINERQKLIGCLQATLDELDKMSLWQISKHRRQLKREQKRRDSRVR